MALNHGYQDPNYSTDPEVSPGQPHITSRSNSGYTSPPVGQALPQHKAEQQLQPQQYELGATPRPAYAGTYSQSAPSQYGYAPTETHDGRKGRRVCGMSLVLLLGLLAGLFFVATIALAAVTGVEANKAAQIPSVGPTSTYVSTATSARTATSLSTATSTYVVSPPTGSAISAAYNDLGCLASSGKVNGTTYKSKTASTFTIYCGLDHPGGDLLVLITASFSDCMDTCADWNNRKAVADQPHCDGVAVIPKNWPTVSNQNDGSCYLKNGISGSNLAPNSGNANIDVGIVQ